MKSKLTMIHLFTHLHVSSSLSELFYALVLLKIDFWGAMTFVFLIIGKKINVFSAFIHACIHAKKLSTGYSDAIILV